MTELREAVSEEEKIKIITNMVLNFTGPSKLQHLMQMAFGGSAMSSAARLTYTCRWGSALVSETHLKPLEGCFIPNYHFYQTASGTAIAVRKGIPHDYVDLTPPVSKSKALLAAVYKQPGLA
jgi:hypothetical protein